MRLPDLADESLIEFAARRFQLLAEPMRLRILVRLEGGELSAGDIAKAVGGNQPNISRHLQALHAAGVLSRRRFGNTIFYGIADWSIMEICEMMCRARSRQAGS